MYDDDDDVVGSENSINNSKDHSWYIECLLSEWFKFVQSTYESGNILVCGICLEVISFFLKTAIKRRCVNSII